MYYDPFVGSLHIKVRNWLQLLGANHSYGNRGRRGDTGSSTIVRGLAARLWSVVTEYAGKSARVGNTRDGNLGIEGSRRFFALRDRILLTGNRGSSGVGKGGETISRFIKNRDTEGGRYRT